MLVAAWSQAGGQRSRSHRRCSTSKSRQTGTDHVFCGAFSVYLCIYCFCLLLLFVFFVSNGTERDSTVLTLTPRCPHGVHVICQVSSHRSFWVPVRLSNTQVPIYKLSLHRQLVFFFINHLMWLVQPVKGYCDPEKYYICELYGEALISKLLWHCPLVDFTPDV